VERTKTIRGERRATIAVAVMLLLGIGGWGLANARSYQLFGRIVPRVATTERVVALTFDDGPEPRITPHVLDVLAQQRVHATFFVEGRRSEQHPQATRAIVAAGHELGNHSYSHRRMVFRSPSFIAREVERTDHAIRAAGYRGTIYFRPPYGKKLLLLPWYLWRHDRTTVTWDVEPDSRADVALRADQIAEKTVGFTRPGSIILLHVMDERRATSLQAVPRIVAELAHRGFRFVTISELLELAIKVR
jgi:peptidoglycan/xylan/chitin deacetylase (PgdA/CDA1 family)